MHIWDHENMFRVFSKSLCEKADGIIYIYDITEYKSFECIPNYIKKVSTDVKKNVYEVLAANKCDKEEDRVVTEEKGKKLAQEFNMNFFETSCLKRQNVNEVFNYLISEILKNIKKNENNDNKIVLNNDNKHENKNGCW